MGPKSTGVRRVLSPKRFGSEFPLVWGPKGLATETSDIRIEHPQNKLKAICQLYICQATECEKY